MVISFSIICNSDVFLQESPKAPSSDLTTDTSSCGDSLAVLSYASALALATSTPKSPKKGDRSFRKLETCSVGNVIDFQKSSLELPAKPQKLGRKRARKIKAKARLSFHDMEKVMKLDKVDKCEVPNTACSSSDEYLSAEDTL